MPCVGRPRPTAPAANPSNHSNSFVDGPPSEYRPPPAFPPTQPQIASGHYALVTHPASRHVPRLDSYQGQGRLGRQGRNLEVVHCAETHEASVSRVLEAPHTSRHHVSIANVEGALSVSATSHQDHLDLSSPNPGYVLPPPYPVQPHKPPQIHLTPAREAQQAVMALPNNGSTSGSTSSSTLDSAREPASEFQVVQYGQPDPEKSLKRKDNPADKQRKETLIKEQGACLKCKMARKQCSGGRMCYRCRRRDWACIRTCNSCWSAGRRSCDEGTRCKNCRLSGITCVRPSNSDAGRDDPHQANLLGIPAQESRTGSSSARVNKHTIRENGRQIRAPTAWGITFDISAEPANSDGLEANDAPSDDAPIGIQTYSQPSTGVDPRHTPTTNNSSTKFSFEDNTLHIPGRQHDASEVPSEATDSGTFFDDATHFSHQDSPPLMSVDADACDKLEDVFWQETC